MFAAFLVVTATIFLIKKKQKKIKEIYFFAKACFKEEKNLIVEALVLMQGSAQTALLLNKSLTNAMSAGGCGAGVEALSARTLKRTSDTEKSVAFRFAKMSAMMTLDTTFDSLFSCLNLSKSEFARRTSV